MAEPPVPPRPKFDFYLSETLLKLVLNDVLRAES